MPRFDLEANRSPAFPWRISVFDVRIVMLLFLILPAFFSVNLSAESSSEKSTAVEKQIQDGYLDINGTSLYYKTMGNGEPIVVLHGGPGFDHRQFLPNIWDLASNFRVILFDQRGTGLSSGPVDAKSITMENFIEDIEGIRRAFGIEKMNLFGHSWGGILAMHYALSHPDKLNTLILASTAASFSSFGEMREAIAKRRSPEDTATLEAISESDAYLAQDPQAIERFWRVYFKVYFADPSLVSGLDLVFTENTIRNANAVAGLILESAGEFELHEELARLSVPSLILHGDSDPMPLTYAERIDASLPDSELVVLEQSGHWVFVDAMKQVNDAVMDFLVLEEVERPPAGKYYSQAPPGLVPELFASGILSTGHHEHSGPIYSPDMRHLFFTVADQDQHVILYQHREGNQWSKTKVAPFSGRYSDDRPFFSVDGTRLFFESKRPVDDDSTGGNWNWWYSDLSNLGWGDARLEEDFSSLDMSTPAIAASGNLYFCATRPEGFGRSDIYVAEFVAGRYKDPVNLGELVNSTAMEAWLHVAPDESYLLFSSFGRDSVSGLYVTFKGPDGAWTEAMALDETINAEGDERFVTVSPDGKYLFFNSQRDGYPPFSTNALTVRDLKSRLLAPQSSRSRGDIYWVDAKVLERFRPDSNGGGHQ